MPAEHPRLYVGLPQATSVHQAPALGFTLDEVRALLNLADERTNICAKVEAIARDHLLISFMGWLVCI